MGLREFHLKYLFDMFKQIGHTSIDGVRMCELGNQVTRLSGRNYAESLGVARCKSSKELFTSLGVQHTSIDRNGEDGALPLDLCYPITDHDLLSSFDIVTNSGTTEHVSNQYACFKNLHSLCKPGGFFIHIVPSMKFRNRMIFPNVCVTHGFYNYSFEFFRLLAAACNYKIINEHSENALVFVTMQKTEDNPFIEKAAFDKLPIHIIDEG